MTEYFTTCKSGDAKALREFLKKEKKHTIVETINSNVELAIYKDNEWSFEDDISGTGDNVIVHSRN